jgi:hypothetical protein
MSRREWTSFEVDVATGQSTPPRRMTCCRIEVAGLRKSAMPGLLTNPDDMLVMKSLLEFDVQLLRSCMKCESVLAECL